MNGAEAVVRTLVASGVDTCFANPGTSEMHFVAALDRAPGLRPVLTLFEGVATGAADGYGRIAGRPACALLHLGSGFSNGAANQHNARRARTPMVTVVGDHADHHLGYDAPLTSDLEGLARPVSGWIRRVGGSAEAGAASAHAVAEARSRGGRPVTLVLPAHAAWDEGAQCAAPVSPHTPRRVEPERIEAIARALARPGAAMILAGPALHGDGLEHAGRIAAATGVHLLAPTSPARLESGAGRVMVRRIPYFAEQAVACLAPYQTLVLAGGVEPVAFFAYPGRPSRLAPADAALPCLAGPEDDIVAALADLADAVGGGAGSAPRRAHVRPEAPNGALTPQAVAAIVARALPDGAIVSDEGFTAAVPTVEALAPAAPHDHLFLTGGAIGQGMPLALGAAVAAPDRGVVSLQGDGSAMYTLQALWSQARAGAKVTTIVFANRAYAILGIELDRVGAHGAGDLASSLLDIGRPALDWVALAHGMGVPAVRVAETAALAAALDTGLRENGPFLIEIDMTAAEVGLTPRRRHDVIN
ncbi:MAG: acetolactate synthase large subunit [Pseudomonadota bacterium]